MPNPLSSDALVLIDAIARRGSFAGAAEELERVPSAVTYAVRRLEESLDVLLFDRQGRRARLTPAGEELLREGRQLLAATDELTRRVRHVADGWEPELRIALDTVLPFESLTAAMQEFLALAPTRLRLSHEVLGGTWDALVAGRADLVVGAAHDRPEPARHGSGLRSVALGTIDFVFTVAPGHPLATAKAPLTDEQLRSHRQVVVADTSQRLAPRASGLLGGEVLVVPSMAAKIAAQKAGLGAGYLPAAQIRAELARGELIALATESPKSAVQWHLAWRAGQRGRALEWWVARLSSADWRAV